FAESWANRGEPILLCMEEMDSRHFAEQLRANEFSIDGSEWLPIPDTINVLGSRFALVLEDLKREELISSLANAQVAIGLSTRNRSQGSCQRPSLRRHGLGSPPRRGGR